MGRPREDREPQTTAGIAVELTGLGLWIEQVTAESERSVFVAAADLRELLAAPVELRTRLFALLAAARQEGS